MKIIYDLSDYVSKKPYLICRNFPELQVHAVFQNVFIRAYPDRGWLCSFFLSAVGCCSNATDVLHDASLSRSFYLLAVQAPC